MKSPGGEDSVWYIMGAHCLWEDYQADQTFENMTRWLKHRAFCHNHCQDLQGAVRLTGVCRKCEGDIEFWATPMPKENAGGREGFLEYDSDCPHCGYHMEGVLSPRGAN